MIYIKQFILSFIVTIGFCIFVNTPKKALWQAGLVGGFSWTANYLISSELNNAILGAFVGSAFVGICAEILATKNKKPATIYLIAGIIPLVPGAGTYYTLSYVIQQENELAYSKALETLGIAVAIAFGILVASLFSNTIKRIRVGKS